MCDNNSDNKSGSTLSSGSPTNASAGAAAVNAQTSAISTWTVSTIRSHPQKVAGVPNFGKLNDRIWRSGQPTRDGYQLLAKQGLKTVVNLREEFPQDKDLIPEGVRYIYIPIKDEHAPSQEQAQEFINAASDPANWPLLVHCHAGEGRAGTMSALVRCALDKWDDKAVMKETNGYISSVMGLFKPELAGCQRQLIQKWEAGASVAGSKAQIATNIPAAAGGSTIGTTVSSESNPKDTVPAPSAANGQTAAGAATGH
jgi:protein tyrosine phosphatase (PTP) superfamily phosphohydrolase (DUF442 family)